MIHAHEILNLIGSNERSFTKGSLGQVIKETYGENAVFTNCSGNPFVYDEIFQFLIERSKIEINEDDTISLLRHNICSH